MYRQTGIPVQDVFQARFVFGDRIVRAHALRRPGENTRPPLSRCSADNYGDVPPAARAISVVMVSAASTVFAGGLLAKLFCTRRRVTKTIAVTAFLQESTTASAPELARFRSRLLRRHTMPSSWFDLDGRVALVTGASRGLGRAMALALAHAGANVILTARTQAGLEEVAHEIHRIGRQALPLAADVTVEDQVRALVRQSTAVYSSIDILVNNAGVGSSRALVDLDLAEWEHTMAVNVRGPMLCCKHVGPLMIQQRRGKIINVASVLAVHVARYMSAYCASKAALVQFTRALALEWVRYNVQVNALCPGYFLTDMNRDFFSTERGQQFMRELPMKRLGEVEELEGAVVFLASSASNYMTGTCLVVDGGLSLR